MRAPHRNGMAPAQGLPAHTLETGDRGGLPIAWPLLFSYQARAKSALFAVRFSVQALRTGRGVSPRGRAQAFNDPSAFLLPV